MLKMRNKLENLTLPTINFVFGVGKGFLDICTTGLPLASVGLELFRGISYLENQSEKNPIFNPSFKDYLSYTSSSLLGSAIPFGIKYHNEIYDFVEGVLK